MKTGRFSGTLIVLAGFALLVFVMLLCICLGSVQVPLRETIRILRDGIQGGGEASAHRSIILSVRVPRVFCVALTGASLALCGAAMQGLLLNPLADGSTLGVSSGASLGAVTALAFGITIPGLPEAGTMGMAMLFAFGSLLLILSLTYALDRMVSTNTIILIGVIFSMFASALMSLEITFAGEKIRSITFWTMGSLSGSQYRHAAILLCALLICGGALLSLSRELNAFSMGEEQASNLGVPVKRVKLTVLILVSVLIGVCVSIGGSIGFVGLVTPHMARMVVGPNHRRLLPVSLLSGAIALLLADLIARTILSPAELPIGVVTSLAGTVLFLLIFARVRKAR